MAMSHSEWVSTSSYRLAVHAGERQLLTLDESLIFLTNTGFIILSLSHRVTKIYYIDICSCLFKSVIYWIGQDVTDFELFYFSF